MCGCVYCGDVLGVIGFEVVCGFEFGDVGGVGCGDG